MGISWNDGIAGYGGSGHTARDEGRQRRKALHQSLRQFPPCTKEKYEALAAAMVARNTVPCHELARGLKSGAEHAAGLRPYQQEEHYRRLARQARSIIRTAAVLSG